MRKTTEHKAEPPPKDYDGVRRRNWPFLYSYFGGKKFINRAPKRSPSEGIEDALM